MCPDCAGLGKRIRIDAELLIDRTRSLKEGAITHPGELELTDLDTFVAGLDDPVAAPLVRKIRSMLGHLIGIGAGYLSLSRSVSTLSGGESQRVKMARQLDCDFTALMYVLDEPSIGLHPRDTEKLVGLLRHLRDQGNSVLVVEHDPDILMAADHVIEMGPGAGKQGGMVIASGTPESLRTSSRKRCASGCGRMRT